MLVKSLTGYGALTLLALSSTACGVKSSPPMLGQSDAFKIVETPFCQKYRCQIDDSVESANALGLKVQMPGNKYSGPLKAPENAETILLNYRAGRLTSGTASLGTTYPRNSVAPEYAELADDFFAAMTGKRLLSPVEYANGGIFSRCLRSLVAAQTTQRSTTAVLASGQTSTGSPYVASCGQARAPATRQTDRSMNIALK